MAEREKEKPTDLLARARKMAQEELNALRAKPEKPVRKTLLKGFGRYHGNLS